jgi:hypothetical protein
MAAVTGAVIGGISALGGVYQAIEGAKTSREAKDALNNLVTPELMNSYEGQQVAKMGNELVSEQNQNRFAQKVDMLAASGIRGVIGGLSDANKEAKQTDLEIKADYDRQQQQIAMAIAGDQSAIRAMEEQRYQGDISALSSQVTAGNAQQMQGIKGAMQGVASGFQMYSSQKRYDDWVKAGSPGGVYQGPGSAYFKTT